MRKASQYAIRVIIAHALVSVLHGAAHLRLNIPLSLFQHLFVVVVIMVLPLVAALLLWKNHHLSGAAILLCSMAGAFLFGVYNHFVASSPDHVSHVGVMAAVGWVIVFQVTAVLLALIEAIGCWVAVWMLKLHFGSSRLAV